MRNEKSSSRAYGQVAFTKYLIATSKVCRSIRARFVALLQIYLLSSLGSLYVGRQGWAWSSHSSGSDGNLLVGEVSI